MKIFGCYIRLLNIEWCLSSKYSIGSRLFDKNDEREDGNYIFIQATVVRCVLVNHSEGIQSSTESFLATYLLLLRLIDILKTCKITNICIPVKPFVLRVIQFSYSNKIKSYSHFSVLTLYQGTLFVLINLGTITAETSKFSNSYNMCTREIVCDATDLLFKGKR